MGRALAKIVALFIIMAIGGAVGILSMLYGWGATPASWSVIIWCLVAQFGLLIVMQVVGHNG